MRADAPDETLDPLVGDWDVFQLARGHRGSTDDRLTAWRAIAARPNARSLLDLGSGVGTVGLTALWHLPGAHLTALEAQALSHALFRRTVAHNRLEARVRSVLGDLRDPDALGPDARFELVTGSPPYTPVGHGTMSAHSQKAHCRMELRGGLEAYCEAARRWMAPGGRFVYVMLAADPRTERFPVEAGLAIVERTNIAFRASQGAFIAICVCAHAEEVGPGDRVERALTVRDTSGEWTDEYTSIMHALRDFPPERRPGSPEYRVERRR